MSDASRPDWMRSDSHRDHHPGCNADGAHDGFCSDTHEGLTEVFFPDDATDLHQSKASAAAEAAVTAIQEANAAT